MDDIWQSLNNPTTYFLLIPLVALVLLYLVVRLAVMHALRDHEKWAEARRIRASRNTYPEGQHYPPITPSSSEPF